MVKQRRSAALQLHAMGCLALMLRHSVGLWKAPHGKECSQALSALQPQQTCTVVHLTSTAESKKSPSPISSSSCACSAGQLLKVRDTVCRYALHLGSRRQHYRLSMAHDERPICSSSGTPYCPAK